MDGCMMLEKTGSTFIYRVYAEGESLFSAEKSLKDYLSTFQDKFGVSLVHEEEKQYEILIYKSKKPEKTNLHSAGKTYEEAKQHAINDFGINPDEFNQTIKIFKTFTIDLVDALKIKNKSTVAGECRNDSRTLSYIL